MSWTIPELTVVPSGASRWDARWKLVSLSVSLMFVGSMVTFPAALVAFACGLVVCAWARLPWRVVARSLGMFLFPVLPWLVILPVWSGTEGREEALLWLGKLGAASCLGAVLVHTTGIPRLLEAASALPCPRVLVQVAQFAYRFNAVFMTELRRLRIALQTRGFRIRSTAHCRNTLGQVVAGALIRSEGKAERVAVAMRSRGYRGHLPRLTPFRTTKTDVLLALAFVLLFGSLGLASLPSLTWVNS